MRLGPSRREGSRETDQVTICLTCQSFTNLLGWGLYASLLGWGFCASLLGWDLCASRRYRRGLVAARDVSGEVGGEGKYWRGLTGGGDTGAEKAARARERTRKAEVSLRPNMAKDEVAGGGEERMGGRSYLYRERKGSVHERCEHHAKWAADHEMHPGGYPNICNNTLSLSHSHSPLFPVSRPHPNPAWKQLAVQRTQQP